MTTSQLAASIATATVISKLLGFVRELFLANYYGTGYVVDAYNMGLSIPNTILAGIISAIATAYMPVFSRKMVDEGEEEANKFTGQLITVQAVIAGTLCVFGWIFAGTLVSWFAPGFTGETAALTVFYLRISFVLCVLNVIKSTLQSYLEYKGSFLINVVLGYVQNVAIIATVIISAMLGMPKLIIAGTAIGTVVYQLGNILLAKKHGYKYRFSLSFGDSTKEVLTLAFPVFISTCIGQINTFFDRMLASYLEEGAVSSLTYGNTLVGVVTAFTFTIFLTIVYPRIAKAIAEGNTERVSDLATRSLNLILVMAVPFTFGIVFFSNEVVQVIFERGFFNETSTAMTATAFMFYGLGIIASGVNNLIARLFQYMKNTKTPAVISGISVVLNIALNFTLVGPMGHAGLALATAISSTVSMVVLYIVFRKKNPDITLITDWKKVLLTVAISLVSVGAGRLLYNFIAAKIWMPRMILLGISVVVAAGIYLVFMIIFKYDELSIIENLVKRGERTNDN